VLFCRWAMPIVASGGLLGTIPHGLKASVARESITVIRRSASSMKRLTGQVSLASEIAGSMPPGSRSLLRDVRELILGARSQLAQTVDASLTMLCTDAWSDKLA